MSEMRANRIGPARRFAVCSVFGAAVLTGFYHPAQGEPAMDLESLAARSGEIARMLPEDPAAPGPPVTDRPAWEACGREPEWRKTLEQAERFIESPIPEISDDLYLDFSKTGNRTRYQNVAAQRHRRFRMITLAECLEDRGRFLAPLREITRALAAEPTWVLPAHDPALENFHGKAVTIDLVSSAVAWDVALAQSLLSARLDGETRDLMRKEVRRRVLDPFLQALEGEPGGNWWMVGTNNWNAVCLANVTGAALALAESLEERARFIAASEELSKHFLAGFTADGYCSEGISYWNYGFGHYVLLAETVRRATAGSLDLMDREGVPQPALYGARVEVASGIYPSFADCPVTARPAREIMYYVSACYGLSGEPWPRRSPQGPRNSIASTMVFGFCDELPREEDRPENVSIDKVVGLSTHSRTWFQEAGVYIGRPSEGARREGPSLAVALKGGHNNEHHNHNDLGTFMAVAGDVAVLVDPGGETYTARTFSHRRYESDVLNSFGHSVPRVAGKLQKTGSDARAKLLRSDFGPASDTLVFDLAGAYEVDGLQTLERTFVFDRADHGRLIVEDRVAFAGAKTFETTLVTFGEWSRDADNVLVLTERRGNGDDAGRSLRVDIDTGGMPLKVCATDIEEDTPRRPVRLGLELAEPVREATVRLTITPLE